MLFLFSGIWQMGISGRDREDEGSKMLFLMGLTRWVGPRVINKSKEMHTAGSGHDNSNASSILSESTSRGWG